MNFKQRKISVFLSTLGALLMIVASGLYLITKWRKEEIKSGDILVTSLISVTSIITFIGTVVYCCSGWYKDNGQKELHIDSEYIPVAKFMGSACGICIEQKDSYILTVVKLTCGHSFHKDCITRSLETQDKCPICRQTPFKYSAIEQTIFKINEKLKKSLMSSTTSPNNISDV